MLQKSVKLIGCHDHIALIASEFDATKISRAPSTLPFLRSATQAHFPKTIWYVVGLHLLFPTADFMYDSSRIHQSQRRKPARLMTPTHPSSSLRALAPSFAPFPASILRRKSQALSNSWDNNLSSFHFRRLRAPYVPPLAAVCQRHIRHLYHRHLELGRPSPPVVLPLPKWTKRAMTGYTSQ